MEQRMENLEAQLNQFKQTMMEELRQQFEELRKELGIEGKQSEKGAIEEGDSSTHSRNKHREEEESVPRGRMRNEEEDSVTKLKGEVSQGNFIQSCSGSPKIDFPKFLGNFMQEVARIVEVFNPTTLDSAEKLAKKQKVLIESLGRGPRQFSESIRNSIDPYQRKIEISSVTTTFNCTGVTLTDHCSFSTNQNLNAMASLSPSEIGAQILKDGVSGDLKNLKEIRKSFGDGDLKQIYDVHSDFSTSRRALHHAAETENLEICGFLIEYFGASVDTPSYSGDTPLIKTAKGEYVKFVECLINHHARVSNNIGFTALHRAVLKDNRELMELLLGNGAPVEIDSVDGTPLQLAASRGSIKVVKLLLEYGAKPKSATSSTIVGSPRVCAIKSMMEALLKGRADPNRYCYGLRSLSYAAEEDDSKYLKSLLETGADPNVSAIGLEKPIEVAALAHNREGVEILFPLTGRLQHIRWNTQGPNPSRKDTAAAAMLFKKFLMAGLTFIMDPHIKNC